MRFLPARSFATLAAAVLVAACASTPEPSFPDVAGEWSGGVDVEGQSVPGTLVVTQEQGALTVTFGAPAFGLTAEGAGTISPEGEIVINLTYNMQCPGQARMTGDLTSEGAVMSGTLEAGDCTGSITGLFQFRR